MSKVIVYAFEYKRDQYGIWEKGVGWRTAEYIATKERWRIIKGDSLEINASDLPEDTKCYRGGERSGKNVQRLKEIFGELQNLSSVDKDPGVGNRVIIRRNGDELYYSKEYGIYRHEKRGDTSTTIEELGIDEAENILWGAQRNHENRYPWTDSLAQDERWSSG